MQRQAMRALALNFRFVLAFDNSRIGAQVRNKLTFMRKNCCKFILLALTFYKNLLNEKNLYFFLLLVQFDLFIDFQSPDAVHTQSESMFDSCVISANDCWTLLYDFVLHSTLRKCIADASSFLCGKNR